jgi:hypothetical protein
MTAGQCILVAFHCVCLELHGWLLDLLAFTAAPLTFWVALRGRSAHPHCKILVALVSIAGATPSGSLRGGRSGHSSSLIWVYLELDALQLEMFAFTYLQVPQAKARTSRYLPMGPRLPTKKRTTWSQPGR